MRPDSGLPAKDWVEDQFGFGGRPIRLKFGILTQLSFQFANALSILELLAGDTSGILFEFRRMTEYTHIPRMIFVYDFLHDFHV
jgi:hypothetical protein